MNVARALVMLMGGTVVGIGFPILWERTKQWTNMGYPQGGRAALLLLIVNALVMLFIVLSLAERWDTELTWRTPLALVIFTLKGWMLLSIRQATHLQNDQLAREGKIDRRDPRRRRVTD